MTKRDDRGGRTPGGSAEAVDAVVAGLRASRRYRTIDEGVVRRQAERALRESGGRAPDAVKRAKRHLHQIFGAYLPARPSYDRLLAELRAHRGSDAEARQVLRRAMATHASTRERLDVLDEMFAAIAGRVPAPRRVIDLACGLNPLAVPWMRLPPEATYVACDIDAGMIRFVDEALEVLGVPHQTFLWDLTQGVPEVEADLTLLLKTLPCLEQQDQGAGARVLSQLRSPYAVCSFPVRSLGGRSVGMRATYERSLARTLPSGWRAEPLDVDGELVFLLQRNT